MSKNIKEEKRSVKLRNFESALRTCPVVFRRRQLANQMRMGPWVPFLQRRCVLQHVALRNACAVCPTGYLERPRTRSQRAPKASLGEGVRSIGAVIYAHSCSLLARCSSRLAATLLPSPPLVLLLPLSVRRCMSPNLFLPDASVQSTMTTATAELSLHDSAEHAIVEQRLTRMWHAPTADRALFRS